jgi:hypothetical protein
MPLLSPKGATSVENHIDVDSLIEDYTWRMFQDMVGFKKAGLESYKHLEREEVEFVIVSPFTAMDPHPTPVPARAREDKHLTLKLHSIALE